MVLHLEEKNLTNNFCAFFQAALLREARQRIENRKPPLTKSHKLALLTTLLNGEAGFVLTEKSKAPEVNAAYDELVVRYSHGFNSQEMGVPEVNTPEAPDEESNSSSSSSESESPVYWPDGEDGVAKSVGDRLDELDFLSDSDVDSLDGLSEIEGEGFDFEDDDLWATGNASLIGD